MKNIVFLFFILSIGAFAEQPRKTSLSGTLSGIEVKSLYYSLPLETTSHYTSWEKIEIDRVNGFRIDLELTHPVFVRFGLTGGIPLKINDKSAQYGIHIPVQPGQDLRLDICREGEDNVLSIYGPEEEGIRLYASLEGANSFYTHYREFLKPYSWQEIAVKMQELKKKSGNLKN